tara:strand:+ start:464 stop:1090 length:627 start_codon:yes stop_codon:yes gene_type:complete
MSQRRIPSLGALAKKVAKLIQEGSVEFFVSDIGNASTISADIIIPDGYNTVFYGPITIDYGTSLRVGDGAELIISKIADVVPVEIPEVQLGGDSLVHIDGVLRLIDLNDSTIRANTIVRDHGTGTVFYGSATINSGFYLKIDSGADLTISSISDISEKVGRHGNPTSINTTLLDNYNTVLYGPITIGDTAAFKIGTGSAAKIINISDV